MSDGVYLRTRYVDPRRGEVREREYAGNGDVWVVVDGAKTLWCHFDEAAVAAARQAVLAADLAALDDIAATGTDLATMTYEWQVGDSSGRFVDAAYPAVVPDALDRLEEALLQLEEAVTGEAG
jgi:hypothetical protein